MEKPSEELVPLASLGKPNVPPLAFPLRLILSEAYRNIYSVLFDDIFVVFLHVGHKTVHPDFILPSLIVAAQIVGVLKMVSR